MSILIDFATVDYGPLTVDPAALDVSLMMDTGLVPGDDWVRLADEIYDLKALRMPAVPPRPERNAANLLDGLHYIRQTAFTVQFSDVEYPVVVALQMLRKASYGCDGAECTPIVWRIGSSVNWPTSISGQPIGSPTQREGRRAYEGMPLP